MERQEATTLDGIESGHRHRYQFAAAYCYGDVLDAACGNGYGSHILSGIGCNVIGLDIEREPLEVANKHYRASQWVCGDILKKPWTRKFDCIVSFETIEHLEEAPKAVEIFRNSLEGGYFIASVPNETMYPFNPKVFEGAKYPHRRHYTLDEFTDLLTAGGFEINGIYTQKEKGSQVEEGTEGRFLLALCR